MLNKFLKACVFACGSFVALPLFAQQEQTLADIRQQAALLSVEIQTLKGELTSSDNLLPLALTQTTLERVDLLEVALAQLTARSEELEHRLERTIKSGTNELDDINFRLCELEAACDIAALPPLQPLDGSASTDNFVNPLNPSVEVPSQLALTEQGDFDKAFALFEGGDFNGSARAFESFTQTYTGGALNSDAHYYRGEALKKLGNEKEAARAYLASFVEYRDGPRAPDALLSLGSSLVALQQVQQGCEILFEIQRRFPDTDHSRKASSKISSLGCAS